MAAHPSIAEVQAGYFYTNIISMVLFGVSCAQAYIYAFNSQKDPLHVRLVAATVMFLELLHTALLVHNFYTVLITISGNPTAFDHIFWSTAISIVCEALLIVIVNGFYMRRVYILSNRNLFLLIVLAVLLFCRTAFTIASVTLMFVLEDWSKFRTDTGPKYTLGMSLGLLAANDFAMTVTLTFFLYRSRTGFKRTNHVLNTLIAYVVNTGCVTVICSVLVIVVFKALPQSMFFGGLVQLASKLYANSFFGMMNMRTLLRPHLQATTNTASLFPSGVFQARSTNTDSSDGFREASKIEHAGDSSKAQFVIA
ncbi:hypothetical protein EIP91_002765 [Steccherinum ochraceum]|uniref:DUF6534 domain-containing protein n=1 Tax=Steccherinum ochraceum TaxID=92696 RepID=A0A4V2MW91_9APHY|nr:hypothetical protein EIP91_002765 [Steccherinum ochraceum]